ncbi:uncharacterized protein LOC133200003 [Saccostrea echinata]|uniref:uncharacterized protein LOC133200003 n=1 Tax=Saccostrea echinata TaxID=191078 RepID=UPI002A7EA6F3|nr:uncharacterized protein LOC133200003 [Saccostrea echinata]
MEQKHKDIIKANYSTLVKNMMSTHVVGHLFASGIITDEMRQQIEAEKTSYDRNRKLISIILRRGKRAFTGLKVALMKADQNELSKVLIGEDSTMTEYEKKLATARSLVVNMTEKPNLSKESKNKLNKRQQLQEPRCRFNLDDFNDLFLTVTPFKGNINIHIRHFTVSNGRFFPTKKGVTFPLARWLKFESLLPEIASYLQNTNRDGEMKWHIGGGVYVSLNPIYSTVDIRHFWKPVDAQEPIPTKKGVTLNTHKLIKLLEVVDEMKEYVPELNDVELCMLSDSHQNQLGMLSCPECTPFGFESQVDNVSLECNVDDVQDLQIIENDIE